MSDPTSTALAPVAPPASTALAVDASPLTMMLSQLRIMWCNVPLESAEAQALLASVVADVSIRDNERLNTTFGIVAALIQHPLEHTSDDGEVWTAPAVTVLTDTGDTFRWFSPGVANCLSVLTMMRPKGKWSPPVYLRCVGIKTARGRQRMTLQSAPAPDAAKTAKEAKRG